MTTDQLEPEAEAPRVILADFLPDRSSDDADDILDRFLNWVGEIGFELYPAQEEALLELMAGRHVILATPTGSGKSLVALGLHFRGLCEGRRSFYTSPIKALASEKFFDLCDQLGAENVGMMTGDASINPGAPVICCTAEVLANMALRRGEEVDAAYVVMDEFHYYDDRERGVAWEIPLLSLPSTQFLLMSATLGSTGILEDHLRQQTEFEPITVRSHERPVPLDYEYRETPLHETIQVLHDAGKTPVYLVNFTQRECAERAQSLTSMQLTTKEEKKAIREAMRGFRFDTPYGKEMKRFLSFGIAVHHAGLLPKYRLLVEQLAQQGLLKVISGTDTLGVGVNIPLRTVLFTKLCKFDGRKVKILSVREFKQIAGRAGRRGFDVEGSVVCQAPDHVIENKRNAAKAAGDPKKMKKLVKRKPPEKGFVNWDQSTFEQLVKRPPEVLKSRFRVDHGMVLATLQRDAVIDDPSLGNFHTLRELVRRSHVADEKKAEILSRSAMLLRSLSRAGVIRMQRDTDSDYLWAVVDEELQADFSLLHALSLFLIEAVESLDPEIDDFALKATTLAESILEDPRAVLFKQIDKAKGELIARLKDERVPYEERMDRLAEVVHPQPDRDLVESCFERFAEAHPWVGGRALRPKSIAREIYEGYLGFDDYVRLYGLQRSEGVLLRYLSQAYKTLDQTIPDRAKTDDLWDVQGFFRAMLERVDSSLIEEWERLVDPDLVAKPADEVAAQTAEHRLAALLADPRAFKARLRAEMLSLVRALSTGDWAKAAASVRQDPEDPWSAERFEDTLAPFFESYDKIVFTPDARQAHWTDIRSEAEGLWRVTQVLVDPESDNLWHVGAIVDASRLSSPEGPLILIERVGT